MKKIMCQYRYATKQCKVKQPIGALTVCVGCLLQEIKQLKDKLKRKDRKKEER